MKLIKLIKDVKIIKSDISDYEMEISVPATDTREVVPNSAFICRRGERFDGHDFIYEAAKRGAKVIISERPVPKEIQDEFDVYNIVVGNTHTAEALIWSNFFDNPAKNIKVVGVTGTNGKTSITYMLRAIFEYAGYKTGIIGTIKNYVMGNNVQSTMTTPNPKELYSLIADMRDVGVEYLFMETSSHALSYDKVAAINFEAGIFTNLTPEHMDFHKTMQNYAEAKAQLFKRCKNSIINYDDPYGKFMFESARGEAYYYSVIDKKADFFAQNIVNKGIRGVEYNLIGDKESVHISTSIPGNFTVNNSLASAACAIVLGVPCSDISLAFRKMDGVKGRMERVRLNADFSVFIDYAHTPDALETVLTNIKQIKSDNETLTVVFGCGGDRDKTKLPLIAEIATRIADKIIITSDNSRTEDPKKIIEDILGGVDKSSNYIVIENRKEAIEYAIMNAKEGEIILIAGKGHEDYEINAQGKHSFSERQIITEAFEKRQKRENR